ncbi:hypothetical protein QGN17_14435 [Sphingomonas sp. MAHUQ-71]|uniref:Uncharacterized protein n=2 Tax=Sphingomonas oryzagri TaxID=3042314 RepID=A0ABT6N3P4_9SPHN|nr:hypothetical protein [Sphingomonas oryzagri]
MIRGGCALLGAMVVAMPATAQVAATPVTATVAPVLTVQKTVVQNGSALPSNSDVWVSLDMPMDSKRMKQGDKFDVTVSRDVMLGDYVVIPRGTHGHGQISYRTGKGAFGKSAKMEFDIIDVQLGQRTIALSGHYRIEGQGNTGATVAAVATVWIASPFITGHSATATQGSEWKGATKEPILVALAPVTPVQPEVVAAPVTATPAVATPAPTAPVATPAVTTAVAPGGAVLTPASATIVKQ